MRMRVICPILLCIAMLLPFANAFGLQAQSAPPPDRETIGAVVQELDTAWNARDAARFSAVFSEDGSFGFPFEGLAWHGRDAIKGQYAKFFPTLPPDLRHVTTIDDFEVLTPDLVGVDFEVDIFGADPKIGASQAPLVHYHGYGLGVRMDSGWRIRSARVFAAAKR